MMHRLANILIAGTEDAYIDQLVNYLADHNYNVLVHDTAEDVFSETRSSHPDILFIDAEAEAFNGIQLAAEIATGKMFSDIPLVLLGEGDPATFYRQALDIGADDAFVRGTSLEGMNFRLRPLLRLATMRAELKRRRLLAQAMGYARADYPDDGPRAPVRILVNNLSDAQFKTVKAVAPPGAELIPSSDPFEAENLLLAELFDAAVLGAGDSPDTTLSLCTHIRSNPRLFNLPVIVVAESDSFDDPLLPYRKGATWCLDGRVKLNETRFALNTLVQRQRMRWKMRGAIDATLAGSALDEKTGLYTFEYLSQHLKTLIDDAEMWRKYLTVVFFSIPTLPDFRIRFGDDAADHLHRQLGKWIRNLVRVEDLVAPYGEKDFCVTLPDTPLEEAHLVMQRIAGIISYTDFAVNDVYQPISVTVEVGLADSTINDTVDQIIARARANLE